MTRDSRVQLWLSAIALLLGGIALSTGFLTVGGHGTESRFMFWVLLSLFLAIASGGLAVAAARRRYASAWVLVAFSSVLALGAFFSMRFVL
jgi:hypothetical protein